MVLLELIFSIVLFSIIGLISTNISLNLYKKNHTNRYLTFSNLTLETTRLFLVRNGVENISFDDEELYFKTDLLLKNVSSFQLLKSGTIATVDICIDNNSICQQWKIKI